MTISLVGKELGAPNRWLENDAIDRGLPEGADLRRIYRDLRGYFGRSDQPRPRFRAYGGGIPQVFSMDGTGVDDSRVRDLMFPDDLWRNRRARRAQRSLP